MDGGGGYYRSLEIRLISSIFAFNDTQIFDKHTGFPANIEKVVIFIELI